MVKIASFAFYMAVRPFELFSGTFCCPGFTASFILKDALQKGS
jgi:hypothetical protein